MPTSANENCWIPNFGVFSPFLWHGFFFAEMLLIPINTIDSFRCQFYGSVTFNDAHSLSVHIFLRKKIECDWFYYLALVIEIWLGFENLNSCHLMQEQTLAFWIIFFYYKITFFIPKIELFLSYRRQAFFCVGILWATLFLCYEIENFISDSLYVWIFVHTYVVSHIFA